MCVCFECMYTHVCSLCVLGPEMKIDPIHYGALVIKVRRNDHIGHLRDPTDEKKRGVCHVNAM